ncbi:MAG: hypothetical protein LBL17_01880 [Coxiellaceae bacterium]|jgi:hypothetical protein|nr:hypothetical protein [Coxiellaceae bacterium]
MDLIKHIQANFYDSINLKYEIAKTLSPVIIDAGHMLTNVFVVGVKF